MSHTRRCRRALLLALAIVLGACDDLTADRRLEACWVGRHGNRAVSTMELPAVQVGERFSVDPLEHPELGTDRLVFVVAFGERAVIPVRVGDNVVNMVRPNPICAWFNDREVYFYDR